MRAVTSLWAPEPFEVSSFLPGFPGGSDSKESVCNMGDPALISGPGRSPGEGTGNPLQYSCLGNPTDRESWRDTVHGVAESDMTEWLTHVSWQYVFLGNWTSARSRGNISYP